MSFTCCACGNEAARPRYSLREGLICSDCAAFLDRTEETYEPEALVEVEYSARIAEALRATA